MSPANPPSPGGSSRQISDLLELEQLMPGHYRGWCHAGAPLRAFGGQVAAQSLTAACHTVSPSFMVHSLHSYFVRPGSTTEPMDYHVEDVRDGRTYATRRVAAEQHGKTTFTLSASFKKPESGGLQRQGTMPAAPDPDSLPDFMELWGRTSPDSGIVQAAQAALEMRYATTREELQAPVEPGVATQKLWIRMRGNLPASDHWRHACALTYASDLLLASTAALTVEPPRMLRTAPSKLFLTSLDHALWFHRPFRADHWMLFNQISPTAGDGRGFARGEIWNQQGDLIATAIQEAVLRPLR